MLKMVNRGVPQALQRLGYSAKENEGIIAHIEKFDTIEDLEDNGVTVRSGLKPGHLEVFDCAFKPYRGLRSIGYLMLNAGRALFRSARVRRAVSRALDRSALAQQYGYTPSPQLLPPAVRGYHQSLLASPANHTVPVVPPGTVASMVVQAGCQPCHQFAAIVVSSLAPLGIDVHTREVANSYSTLQSDAGSIDIFDSGTELPYPDPASFLQRMLLSDVPRGWLPISTKNALAALARLSGTSRDATAVRLAKRFEEDDVPVIAYGFPTIDTLVAPRLGCRVWTGDDTGLDLASLCLR
jgi:ABC-type transport system substrate-binding protein